MSLFTRRTLRIITMVGLLAVAQSSMAAEQIVWSNTYHSRLAEVYDEDPFDAHGTDVHDDSVSVTVPKFNPSLGTLTSVKIEYSGDTESLAYHEWSYTLSGITGVLDYEIDCTTAGVNFWANGAKSHPGIYGGSSTPGWHSQNIELEVDKTVTYTDGTTLAAVTGTGNITFESAFSVSVGGQAYDFGPDTAFIYGEHQAIWAGVITITYTYTP